MDISDFLIVQPNQKDPYPPRKKLLTWTNYMGDSNKKEITMKTNY